MNSEVAEAIEELRRAFSSSEVTTFEDGSGGAHVIVEEVELGLCFTPDVTWMGGHIPAQYPYADIYPLFMDAGVRRSDGRPFEAPITHNASYAGRAAIQISRRNNQIHSSPQTAVAKFIKVLDFLEKLP